MQNKKLDTVFLQRKLGDLLGMEKEAKAKKPNERLAELTKKVKENMKLVEEAMKEKEENEPNDAAGLDEKEAESKLVYAILTDNLEEPYGKIAKAAGTVVLNCLCNSKNR